MTAANTVDPPDEQFPKDHQSGFVAVVGKPNVGKSTLINCLLREKLAIVSPKPQTTREQQLGILSLPQAQVVFVDTPGVHEIRSALGRYMVETAMETIPDADVIVFVVDVSRDPDGEDEKVGKLVRGQPHIPTFLVLNKCDLVSDEVVERRAARYKHLAPGATTIAASAERGYHVDELLTAIVERLPAGPPYYPSDQLTETLIRDNAAEIIREKILLAYEDEVPHAVAVRVDEFKERNDRLTYIAATIFVEKDSQKGILIGRNGAALKRVGQMARPELERMIGTAVYLQLWVKVLKNWRRDARALRLLGYARGR